MIPPIALTIAGSDSGGGAGIQADLKTFAVFGVYGTSVVTALTAQNTRRVRAVLGVEPAFVVAQLDAILDDFAVAAGKTGMLGGAAVIEAVAGRLAARPLPALVVDPVMVATSGDALLEPDAVEVLRRRLVPLATLVTPNLHEAGALLGVAVTTIAEMRRAARALVDDLGARAALVKGGHLVTADTGDAAPESVDVLYDGRRTVDITAPRRVAGPIHGTGCALSAAIVAGLAHGRDLEAAVREAKRFVSDAIAAALALGQGALVLHHAGGIDPTGPAGGS
jgi:hydroxymethylpyrimidine/phosphomethylpyrimidine kinase